MRGGKFCQLVVGRMGYSSAEVSRYLGITTSSVNRLAVSEETANLKKYLKMLENLRSFLSAFHANILGQPAVPFSGSASTVPT